MNDYSTNARNTLRDIAMDGLERGAVWMKWDADQVAYYSKMLRSQPPYETRAHDELKNAQAALAEAIGVVAQCLEAYEALPVEKPRV